MNYRFLNILFTVVLLLLLFLYLNEHWPFWPVPIFVFIYVLFILVMSTNVQFNFFMKAHNRNPLFPANAISISFDDGPNENTLKILDILDAHDIQAAFFCIGKRIKEYPEIFQEIIERGHIVGNHTYSHSRRIGFLSSETIHEEIKKCDEIAEQTAGVKMKLFRPPFGIINPKTRRALLRTGHEVIGWNVRPYDAITKSPEVIINRITRKIKKGDVVLLHDNIGKTAIILEQLLVILKQQKIDVVRLDKLFEIDAYT